MLRVKSEMYCRTCLANYPGLISLTQNNLNHILLVCTSINIEIENGSEMICDNCRETLLSFYNFRQSCLNNQKLLHSKSNGKLKAVNFKQEVELEENKNVNEDDEHEFGLEVKINDGNESLNFDYHDNVLSSDSREIKSRAERKLELRKKRLYRKKVRSKSERIDKTEDAIKTKKHKCSQCPAKFYTSLRLSQHEAKHDDSTDCLSCPECPKQFFLPRMLNNHIKSCHEYLQPSFNCFSCTNGEFYTQEQLAMHTKKSHSNDLIDKSNYSRRLCPFCDKSVYKLRKHVENEHAECPLICKICSKEYKNPTSFVVHIDMAHPTARNIQKNMDDNGLNSVNFEKICETHGNRKKLTCTYCGKNFKVDSTLKAHMDRHQGIDPRQICFICGKKFNNIKTHVEKTHMQERKYTCRYCQLVFKHMPELREHSRLQHTEERENQEMNFECNLCGKKFSTNCNLRHHQSNQHNELRPFECTICGKRFKKKAQINNHMKAHADVRPFACDLCDRKFRERTTLKIHMMKHTGERPFGCTICHRAFTSRKQRNWHWKTVHHVKADEMTMPKIEDINGVIDTDEKIINEIAWDTKNGGLDKI